MTFMACRECRQPDGGVPGAPRIAFFRYLEIMLRQCFAPLGWILFAILSSPVRASQAGPNAVWQDALLASSDLAQDDGFGASLATDDGWLVIGSPREDGSVGFPSNYGAAYVYQLVGSTWTERQKLEPSDPIPGGEFGGAVAIDGSLIAVGGPSDQCAERVYLFRQTGGLWAEEVRLDDPGAGACARFGVSLALRGDLVLVGATRADVFGGPSDAGAVYVFRNIAGQWTFEQTLNSPAPQTDGSFGQSVALAGGFAYVGEPGRRGGVGSPGGRCLVYSDTGSGWALEQILQPANSASDDRFGESLDVSGDELVVGAPRAFAPGSVYAYQRQMGSLNLVQEVQLLDPEAATSFGSDVAIAGDTLLVGGNTADVQASSSGGAFQFRRSGGVFEERFALWTTNAASGSANAEAVGIAGDQLLTSSSTKSIVGSASGVAFVYEAATFPDVNLSYCPGKVSSTGCSTNLRTIGVPSPSAAEPFQVRGTGFGLSTLGLIFYSLGADDVPFAGGTLCLEAPVRRLGFAVPGGLPFGTSPCQIRILSGVGLWISSGVDGSLVAGARMHCQMFFRDSGDPTGLGLSDALSFVIQP